MSEYGRRIFNHPATAAFGLLLAAVAIFGPLQAQRFVGEAGAQWSPSYEGTPRASTEMAAHSARANRALLLLAVDGAVGWAGVCAFAAFKRISGLSWAAAATFLLFAGLCAGA